MLSFEHFLALNKGDASLSQLFEGGNVWKGDLATQRINQADVLPTVKWLEQLTGLPLADNLTGTTGTRPTSGDIDLLVDASKVNKEQVVSQLTAWAKKNDPTALVKKSGVNVHFRTPIKGDARNGYVQTDLMFVPDLEFGKWSMTPSANTQYKGMLRKILLASIAKSLGFRWNFMHGLVDRETNDPVSGGKDLDNVAKVLLDKSAIAKDLESVESILAKLKNDPNREAKLADAKKTFSQEGSELQ
ncbi:hypothetical protein E4H12_05735 [Candidatus Thorarchaeota archaeon]|nr:MAG: hypothetical protein E4H12_05735 [Candidatus Thorarchaeota archaeon]